MLFSWANKQLEKLSETMAPMSNSATGQFTQALQQNDINTAMGLLRSGGGGGGGSVSAPSSMSHQYSYSNSAQGGSGPTEAETFIDPHHTIFHNQKQNKALHIIAQYSNMTLFSYVINTFYTSMGMDMMEVLNLRDANGDTILHYAAMSTTPKAFSFVQSLVNNYKEQIVKSLNVKNHYNQTPYDVSANDKIRQFLLPLQLQYETQECLKNGGVGLPKGIDLGGLKIENSNMAPPPIMSSGSGLGGPGVGPSAGGPPMNGNGGGNMYSMGNSGVTKVRYAIPTELANATSPSTTPTASLSPMNYQYNQSQFSPSAAATISPTAAATATPATMMMMQPNTQQPTSDTAATATVADTSATSVSAVTAAATTISPSPTASSPATATLPSGWIELMDQTSNTPYYYNQETNVTQWERPISPVAQTDTNTNTSVADNTSAAVTDTIDTNSNAADSCTEIDNNENTTTEAVVVDDTNVETKEDIVQEKEEETQNDELKEEEQTEAERMNEKDESIPITKDEKKEEELNEENSNIVDKASNVATVSSVTDTSDINNNKIETETETATVLGETKEESPGLEKTEISTETEKETTQETNLIAGKEQLPEGWTELYDETSRNSYYYHQGNNVTQWDRPTAAAVATMANGNFTNSSSSLPSGWVELVDPSSGAAYYYNQQQNLTQWEKPIDTASASIATTPATTMMNPARNTAWKTQKPSTSAPSSAPSNSKYAKRGFSTAAVLPSNSKYKPDGFHSSSSDKTLQQKYGHDASITAPPSGRHFSGATSIAPPPSSSGSNVNISKGYNPYAGSAGVGGYGTNYPSAGYNNNNAYGYNSGNASTGASQYNAYNPSTNYNQHSGMTTGSDYQYQMNTTNDYQSQLAAGGYNNQQQQNPYSYPTANHQQQPQPHQQYPTADASFQSTPNVLGNGEVPPSSDINDQTVSKPDANDKTVDTSITNEEKRSMDDQHQTSFSPDTQLPDATPKIATEAFDSNFAAKEETVVVADSVPAKEEQITPTVESSENTPSEVQINDKNTDTVETNNTFAQSDSAAAFFGVGVEEASLPIENEDDILPPPPIINDAIETSEITDMAIDQSNDIILSPPPTITDEVDNKPVTDSTIGDLMPPPILSIPDEKDDEKKNDEIGSIEKSDDLMPPPTFLGRTVDDADSDQLLPPPPMMDIAL